MKNHGITLAIYNCGLTLLTLQSARTHTHTHTHHIRDLIDPEYVVLTTLHGRVIAAETDTRPV